MATPPNSVAQKEKDALIDWFVPHPFLLQAHAQVRQILALPQAYGIVLVAGPPGVGKTKLTEACALVDPADPKSGLGLPCPAGAIPLVTVTAKSGTNFPSRYKGLLKDILAITNKPLAEAPPFQNYKIPQLESAVIDSLRYRHTIGLLVDEIQDLAAFGSSTDFFELARSLKHLGSATNTVLVLFGSYSVLKFLELDAQLSRRCSVVEFPRYDRTKPDDEANFQRVFATFCEVAPTLLSYDRLSPHIPMLYTGSAGGAGNLRLWLLKAVGLAIHTGAPCVTVDHLRVTALADTTILKTLADAQAGEADCAKLHASLDAITNSLFTNVPFARAKNKGVEAHQQKQPGKRNPMRDPLDKAA